jgi:hypothetical protein
MSPEPEPQTERPPERETLAEALARERKKADDLGAKIDAVEQKITPTRPQNPSIGGMIGD